MTHSVLHWLEDELSLHGRHPLLPYLLAIFIGTILLFLSTVLIERHAVAIRAMREEALPLAAAAIPLEQRLALLQNQEQAIKEQAALRTGSPLEKLNVYVFPKSTDRAIHAVNFIMDSLHADGHLKSLSAIDVSDVSGTGGLLSKDLTMTVRVDEQGMDALHAFFASSGLMSVADALSADQKEQLFTLTEHDSPASVATLGQVFSTDLLVFLRDPSSQVDRLASSFSSDDSASAVRKIFSAPFFKGGEALFTSGLASELLSQKLWPLPFLRISHEQMGLRDDGLIDLTLTVRTYGRA